MKEKMTNHGVCDSSMNRRSALKGIATAITPLIVPINGQAAVKPALPLGLDGHAMRGMKWKSLQHIEYAAKLKLDAVLFNGPHYFEALTDSHLKKVKMAADAAGLRIYMGIGGISEGAKSYKATFGNGADTLRQGIRMAKLLGSPVINCRIGNIDDRYSEGGIKARLAEAARSLKAVANEVRDAGLKCAFEKLLSRMKGETIRIIGSDKAIEDLSAQQKKIFKLAQDKSELASIMDRFSGSDLECIELLIDLTEAGLVESKNQ